MKQNKKINRSWLKKEGEELQAYLQFRRKGGKYGDNKKYSRNKMKKEFDKEKNL